MLPCIRWLVDCAYPEAEYLRIVQDNLNTHTPAALYEAFPQKKLGVSCAASSFITRAIHGSWLNMAEIEISIFQRGCLSRRVDCLGTLRRRINTASTHTQPGALFDLVAVYDERGSSEIAPPVSRSPKRTEGAGVRRGSWKGSTHVTYNEMNPGA